MAFVRSSSSDGFCEPCRRWAVIPMDSTGKCFKCNSFLITPEEALGFGLIDGAECTAHGGIVPKKDMKTAARKSAPLTEKKTIQSSSSGTPEKEDK